MFGLRSKKPAPADGQIPYEIYQTVHAPTARRRRWVIRLIVALAVVTLVVAGIIALRNESKSSKATTGGSSQAKVQPKSNEPGGTQKPSQQAPQNNPPLPKSDSEPAQTPQNSDKNSGTVPQPE